LKPEELRRRAAVFHVERAVEEYLALFEEVLAPTSCARCSSRHLLSPSANNQPKGCVPAAEPARACSRPSKTHGCRSVGRLGVVFSVNTVT
jgi:hypothetical protein